VKEVVVTKKASTIQPDRYRAQRLFSALGSYSLAALTPPKLIADYRDRRLAQGRANDTVRLELGMLSHLYSTAIKEWRIGLFYNRVSNIRKPAPGAGRRRRQNGEEEQRLVDACTRYSNPMLGWLVRLAIHTGMRMTCVVPSWYPLIQIWRPGP